MKKIIVLFVSSVLFGASCFAQSPKVAKGSTVYVAPMHGYEAYIIAALQKEHVPLIAVTDRSKAQYVIDGVINHKDLQGHSAVTVNNTNAMNAHQGSVVLQREAAERTFGETSTSLTMIDPRSTQIVFSCSTDEMGSGQLEHGAEDFAKHLKKLIDKGK